MENLEKAAEELITYMEEADVYDTVDNDGDGHFDYSQSTKLKELIDGLQVAIDDSAPIRDAMKLIKKCFITTIQTACWR